MASLAAHEKPLPRRKPSLAWLKPGVLVGSSIPLLDLVLRASRGELGANPVSEALNRLGLLALIFLIASLACTPLKLFGWATPMRLRRMLGLLAFFYASLHFGVYLFLDRLGAQSSLTQDLTERPFISAGFLAWLSLVPLAATSTAGMIKRLGAARWRKLHRLAYVAAGLGALHFVWRVKRDVTEPVIYGLVLLCLLAVRFKRTK
ncbi:MAG: protein-methionine-sulfoxide reductase heme-binding subunit MsrQ [Myxococcales bacterium]